MPASYILWPWMDRYVHFTIGKCVQKGLFAFTSKNFFSVQRDTWMFIFKRKFTYLAGSNIATEEFFLTWKRTKKFVPKSNHRQMLLSSIERCHLHFFRIFPFEYFLWKINEAKDLLAVVAGICSTHYETAKNDETNSFLFGRM
jgi:hypothetical protein